MKPTTKAFAHAFAATLASLARTGTVLGLLYKVYVANDLSHTIAQDPMELWIAVALAFLLLDNMKDRET